DTEAYSRNSTRRGSNEEKPTPAAIHWHVLQPDRVADLLQTDPGRGLAHREAQRRLDLHGPNRLPEARRQPVWLRFLSQFNNFLIYIMLAAALIMLALAHWIDAAVLFSAVIVNAVLGFIQEGKAESALQAIGKMLSPRATVIRDGVRLEIEAD